MSPTKLVSKCGKIVAVTIVLLMFAGCATVSVNSVRDPSFSNSIHKLFIIVNHGQIDDIDKAYTPYLVEALKDEFSRKSVETMIQMANPLALDDSALFAGIGTYKPDGVLAIVATGGVAGPYGGMRKIIYNVSLFDPLTKKRVWRARIDASGGEAVQERRMRIMAHDLVMRLDQEKLLSPQPVTPGQST